jgi:arginase
MSSFSSKSIKILGNAVSIGQPKKGVEHTPAVLKIDKIDKLIHPTRSEWVDILNQPAYRIEKLRQAPIRNLPEVAKVNRWIYEAILRHAKTQDFFLNIGGDHSIGSSTLTALNKVHNENLSVIWIDAHGDFNTPITSPSGNYHGMPLAHALGLFREKRFFDWGQKTLDVGRVAMIGIRDLDPEEKVLMDSSKLLYFTMNQVRRIGIRQVMEEVLEHVDPKNNRMVHLSLDVDGFDPRLFPGTGTAVPDGLSFEDYSVIISYLRRLDSRFVSMDLVEVNLEIERDITLMNVKELLKQTFH